MKLTDLTEAAWRKSSHSNGQAECVELARLTGGQVAARDSKDKGGPALVFSPGAFRAFVRGVLDGEYAQP